MRSCAEHEFKAYIEQDNEFYNFPIHEDDIKKMPDSAEINKQRKNAPGASGANNLGDYWLNSVGDILYEKFIKHYNEKMWMVKSVNEIDTFNWSPKGPSIASGKGKVFSDKISAYPIKLNGYDDYFPIATKDVKVLLNTEIKEYDIKNKSVKINNEKISFDIIVNTLPPDIIFNFELGSKENKHLLEKER